MTYDPVPTLEKLHIPVLAMWGSKDTFLPVPRTVAAFKRAMAKAGNKDYVIKIYPNASHSLLETNTGSPSTGGKETNFVPGLWKMETDWVFKRVARM
jgi:pimeloyl-ACP methyl ester carboxylesterase